MGLGIINIERRRFLKGKCESLKERLRDKRGVALFDNALDRIEELEDALRQVLLECEDGKCTKDKHTECYWCKDAWEILESD